VKLLDKCKDEYTYNNRLINNIYATNITSCNLDFYNWEVTVDNCASIFIKKLFDFYVEDGLYISYYVK